MGKETIKAYVVSYGTTERDALQGVGRPLSLMGRIQAEAVANALAISGIISIASSNLPEALETARIMGNSLGAARQTYSELRERGQVSDLGETREGYLSFSQRVIDAFNTAVSHASRLEGNFVIVSDAGPITVILEHLGKKRKRVGFQIPNGSITTLVGKRNSTLKDFSLLVPTKIPPPIE